MARVRPLPLPGLRDRLHPLTEAQLSRAGDQQRFPERPERGRKEPHRTGHDPRGVPGSSFHARNPVTVIGATRTSLCHPFLPALHVPVRLPPGQSIRETRYLFLQTVHPGDPPCRFRRDLHPLRCLSPSGRSLSRTVPGHHPGVSGGWSIPILDFCPPLFRLRAALPASPRSYRREPHVTGIDPGCRVGRPGYFLNPRPSPLPGHLRSHAHRPRRSCHRVLRSSERRRDQFRGPARNPAILKYGHPSPIPQEMTFRERMKIGRCHHLSRLTIFPRYVPKKIPPGCYTGYYPGYWSRMIPLQPRTSRYCLPIRSYRMTMKKCRRLRFRPRLLHRKIRIRRRKFLRNHCCDRRPLPPHDQTPLRRR